MFMPDIFPICLYRSLTVVSIVTEVSPNQIASCILNEMECLELGGPSFHILSLVSLLLWNVIHLLNKAGAADVMIMMMQMCVRLFFKSIR